ncbi:hypothetical protein Q3C01_29540 [Bradyrhizobium sp. UFLA05-109]
MDQMILSGSGCLPFEISDRLKLIWPFCEIAFVVGEDFLYSVVNVLPRLACTDVRVEIAIGESDPHGVDQVLDLCGAGARVLCLLDLFESLPNSSSIG